MPSPEHREGEPFHEEPEAQPKYWRASRFADEECAGDAYFQAQDALFGSGHELSAYRFQLQQQWNVAVVGEPPSPGFDHTIQTILAFLNHHRIQTTQFGPWVEGHYRPGKPMGES